MRVVACAEFFLGAVSPINYLIFYNNFGHFEGRGRQGLGFSTRKFSVNHIAQQISIHIRYRTDGIDNAVIIVIIIV